MSSNSQKLFQNLWDELLHDNPDLESQKSYFLELFERLITNKPKIDQDPLFEKQLRDRLRFHLITQYEPAPAMNRWHKLLIYGAPTIIVATFLVAILPLQDLQLWSPQTLELLTSETPMQEAWLAEEADTIVTNNLKDTLIDHEAQESDSSQAPSPETLVMESSDTEENNIASASLARSLVITDKSEFSSTYVSGDLQLDYNLIQTDEWLFFEWQIMDYSCQIGEWHLQLIAFYQELDHGSSGLVRFDADDGDQYFILLDFDNNTIVWRDVEDRTLWCKN